jgi:hypothetical protein
MGSITHWFDKKCCSTSFHDGGYIVHDGYCQCGSLLADHNGLQCPGAQNDPYVADKELLKSLIGQPHLALME